MTAEIDFLIRIDDQGVIIHDEVAAPAALVEEWLSTPVGSVYGKPDWGNRLALYKHEPVNDTTATMIKNSILLKIPGDLPQLAISGVAVISHGNDTYRIAVGTHAGVYQTAIKM